MHWLLLNLTNFLYKASVILFESTFSSINQIMFDIGGVTDLQTAKLIARKLFQNYNNSN
jgi:hypothetical protein